MLKLQSQMLVLSFLFNKSIVSYLNLTGNQHLLLLAILFKFFLKELKNYYDRWSKLEVRSLNSNSWLCLVRNSQLNSLESMSLYPVNSREKLTLKIQVFQKKKYCLALCNWIKAWKKCLESWQLKEKNDNISWAEITNYQDENSVRTILYKMNKQIMLQHPISKH